MDDANSSQGKDAATEAMAGGLSFQERARRIDQPEPGFFLKRLVRGGWQVPCRIIRWPDGLWQAEVDGELLGYPHADPAEADGVQNLWLYGQATTEAEYRYRMKLRAWAAANEPRHFCLRPREPIDLTTAASLF